MKQNDIEDLKIRQLLDKKLSQAPQNEWFVKKVINRLPEKQRSAVSIIEIIGYAIAIIAILGIECSIIYEITTTATLTLKNLVWLIALNIVFFAIVFAIISPQFRNSFSY